MFKLSYFSCILLVVAVVVVLLSTVNSCGHVGTVS